MVASGLGISDSEIRSLEKTANSNDLLESILENIGAGIIALRSNGEFLVYNQNAVRILGDAPDALMSNWSRVSGLFQADQVTLLPQQSNPFVKAMRGDYIEKEEIFVRNHSLPSGAWCSVSIRPFRTLSGDAGGVIILEDITDRKRLADEINRSNRDLQQFAYVAAHDLQEPLRSIVGFGELLEKRVGGSLDEKSLDYLRRILGAAKRMQQLVSALLAYARVETRAKPKELCDCSSIVHAVLSDMSSMIEAAHAHISVDTLPSIMADRSQVSQLFSNLIANALKYKGDSSPEIHIRCTDELHAFHHFSVSDNGIGIDMQFAERIFVLFQRLHSKTEYEGVGIGLSLCKKIVERHGGNIWIESEPGVGTQVHFTIPK